MANEEHVAILKQGVEAWNQWRKNHAGIRPDLGGLQLGWIQLKDANLSGADLSDADLNEANLHGASLSDADLIGAKFSRAALSDAHLNWAKLSMADLSDAHISGAYLRGANLHGTSLTNADFSQVIMWGTVIGDVDLSTTKGLETVRHEGPSTIGIDTIYRSQGKIPEAILRGAGVPDSFITYMRSLIGEAIKYYSCFICHSSQDTEIAERLYADLQSKSVHCWYAPEDLHIGEPFLLGIDRGIRLYEKLLVILSAYSIGSKWVEQEVLMGMGKDPGGLFPIRLDDAVMQTHVPWAHMIRQSRQIGDFTHWKEHDAYQKAFDRLLRDLKAEAS